PEAADRPGVTGRAEGHHVGEHGVAVAIGREPDHALHVPAGLPLAPQAAAPGGVVHFPGALRPGDGFPIGMGDHQHRAGPRIARRDRPEPTALAEVESHRAEASPARPPRASAALVATVLPPNAVGRPLQSVNTPPASSTMGWRAAASQGAITPSTI